MVHIIKITASIPTKFCTTIKTTKCSSLVVQTSAQQIQDGRRPPYWKNDKSPCFGNGLTYRQKIGLLTHFGRLEPSELPTSTV